MFLVGNAKAGTVATFRIVEERIERVQLTEVGVGCSTFTITDDLVHCAVKEPSPAIVTLRLDRESGSLTELSRREIDDPVVYLTMAKNGTLLLGASYDGGWGDAWPVGPDGVLGLPVGERVEHPNMHCVVAEGDSAWFVSLGADLVAHADLSTGGLMEIRDNTLHLPGGCGPRHLVLDGDDAFLITEYSGELLKLRRDGAELQVTESTPIFSAWSGLSHSRMGADPLNEQLIWGADVHVAGDFVLASERTASTIASIRDGNVWALSPVQPQPRGFTVGPDERHIVVAGEGSGWVSLCRIHDDGQLQEIWAADSGAGANWVRFC